MLKSIYGYGKCIDSLFPSQYFTQFFKKLNFNENKEQVKYRDRQIFWNASITTEPRIVSNKNLALPCIKFLLFYHV